MKRWRAVISLSLQCCFAWSFAHAQELAPSFEIAVPAGECSNALERVDPEGALLLQQWNRFARKSVRMARWGVLGLAYGQINDPASILRIALERWGDLEPRSLHVAAALALVHCFSGDPWFEESGYERLSVLIRTTEGATLLAPVFKYMRGHLPEKSVRIARIRQIMVEANRRNQWVFLDHRIRKFFIENEYELTEKAFLALLHELRSRRRRDAPLFRNDALYAELSELCGLLESAITRQSMSAEQIRRLAEYESFLTVSQAEEYERSFKNRGIAALQAENPALKRLGYLQALLWFKLDSLFARLDEREHPDLEAEILDTRQRLEVFSLGLR